MKIKRPVSKYVATSLLSFLPACDLLPGLPLPSLIPQSKESTLDAGPIKYPEDLIHNPYVRDAISKLNEVQRTTPIFQNSTFNPPNLAGQYRLTRTQLIPQQSPLEFSTLTINPQTPDNYLSFNADSFTQSSTEVLGNEIVRGDGNSFSIYRVGKKNNAEEYFLANGSLVSDKEIKGEYIVASSDGESQAGIFTMEKLSDE